MAHTDTQNHGHSDLLTNSAQRGRVGENSHKGGLQCDWCESGAEESQGHAKECDGWEEERRGLNMDTMEDIIIFFQRILKSKSDKRKEGLI